MAKGKKTGGRNFKKGNRGKPKGAKDHFPRGSLKAILETLLDTKPELYGNTVRNILENRNVKTAGARVALCGLTLRYVDGEPEQSVKHTGVVRLRWPE